MSVDGVRFFFFLFLILYLLSSSSVSPRIEVFFLPFCSGLSWLDLERPRRYMARVNIIRPKHVDGMDTNIIVINKNKPIQKQNKRMWPNGCRASFGTGLRAGIWILVAFGFGCKPALAIGYVGVWAGVHREPRHRLDGLVGRADFFLLVVLCECSHILVLDVDVVVVVYCFEERMSISLGRCNVVWAFRSFCVA